MTTATTDVPQNVRDAWAKYASDYDTDVPGFVSITKQMPLVGQVIEYVGVFEGRQCVSGVGFWRGDYMLSGALAMDYGDIDDDREACTHWRRPNAQR